MEGGPLPSSLRERYASARVVGRGAMGRVIACVDVRLKRDVAVKLMEPRAADAEGLARFAREAQILARVSHPRVVRIYDAGQADGMPYIVMELLQGRSLADRLADGPLDEREVRDLLDALLDGLAVVHDAGVLHRDIKPSNVVLRPDGTPVLVDFGLARGIDASTMLTGAGNVVGTPFYLPPEVLFGDPAAASTDLWGIAATAFECLVGRPPIRVIADAPLPEALGRMHTGAYHPYVARALEPHGPLGALLSRALSPDRAARPLTARDFRTSLTASSTSTSTSTSHSPPAARRLPPRTRRFSPLALLLAIPLLIALFALLPRPTPPPLRSPAPPTPTSPPRAPAETNKSLNALANELEAADPNGDGRRAVFELGERLGRTRDQAAVTREARAFLAASRLELLRPFEVTPALANPAMRVYRQLWTRYALERIGGPELASRSRVLPFFPEDLRPGVVPPGGRTFDVDLSREVGLTTDPLVQGLATLDGTGAFADVLTWRVPVQGLARARRAWVAVSVKAAPPTDRLRVQLNRGFHFELMTPELDTGTQFTHSVPVWMLREGENELRVKLGSLLARREGMLTGFVRLRVVLAP